MNVIPAQAGIQGGPSGRSHRHPRIRPFPIPRQSLLSVIMGFERIAFVAAPTPDAAEARVRLARLYGNVPVEDADVIVALGGDGMMLHTVHDLMDGDTPIFGMNRGSVGFLMNEYSEEGLVQRLEKAHRRLRVFAGEPLYARTQHRQQPRNEGREIAALERRHHVGHSPQAQPPQLFQHLFMCVCVREGGGGQ
mgnify:CR=1 FL=1